MHIPVLLNEVIECLNPKSNENFVDCTVGFAGHAKAILEKIKPNGRVLGIEIDPQVCQMLNQERNKGDSLKRLLVVNDSYVHLKKIVQEHNFYPVQGVLLDLGLSSWDLEKSAKGFSFSKDEPLDMRYAVQHSGSKTQSLTAKEIVNEWTQEQLAGIFRDFGQERFAKTIAKNIVKARKLTPIETTFQLVEIIRKSFPRSYKFGKVHFATRVFQALRIAVNNELENLKTVLPQTLEVLEPNGRIVVISFHSLEDSIVKKFFKENAKNGFLQILTKKPLLASFAEIKNNPKARSAKLRAARKL